MLLGSNSQGMQNVRLSTQSHQTRLLCQGFSVSQCVHDTDFMKTESATATPPIIGIESGTRPLSARTPALRYCSVAADQIGAGLGLLTVREKQLPTYGPASSNSPRQSTPSHCEGKAVAGITPLRITTDKGPAGTTNTSWAGSRFPWVQMSPNAPTSMN